MMGGIAAAPIAAPVIGAAPADVAAQPVKAARVGWLNTAKRLGVAISPAVLARADAVIQ
jgi:hypothetical protein